MLFETVMRGPSSNSCGRCGGRIFNRRRWNLSRLSNPLGGSLFRFEQLLHGHRLVDMVFGSRDLLTRDQEPHIGMHPSFGRARRPIGRFVRCCHGKGSWGRAGVLGCGLLVGVIKDDCPVLCGQIMNSSELSRIVSNQRQAQSARK